MFIPKKYRLKYILNKIYSTNSGRMVFIFSRWFVPPANIRDLWECSAANGCSASNATGGRWARTRHTTFRGVRRLRRLSRLSRSHFKTLWSRSVNTRSMGAHTITLVGDGRAHPTRPVSKLLLTRKYQAAASKPVVALLALKNLMCVVGPGFCHWTWQDGVILQTSLPEYLLHITAVSLTPLIEEFKDALLKWLGTVILRKLQEWKTSGRLRCNHLSKQYFPSVTTMPINL